MERSMKSTFVVLAVAACLLATGALAQQYKAGPLEIDHPWSRATPKGAKIGAGYLTIKNTGSAPDRLVRVDGGCSQRRDPPDDHGRRRDEDAARRRRARDQAGRKGRAQARWFPPDVQEPQAATHELPRLDFREVEHVIDQP